MQLIIVIQYTTIDTYSTHIQTVYERMLKYRFTQHPQMEYITNYKILLATITHNLRLSLLPYNTALEQNKLYSSFVFSIPMSYSFPCLVN